MKKRKRPRRGRDHTGEKKKKKKRRRGKRGGAKHNRVREDVTYLVEMLKEEVVEQQPSGSEAGHRRAQICLG